jgi:hypothetical protein
MLSLNCFIALFFDLRSRDGIDGRFPQDKQEELFGQFKLLSSAMQ